MPFLRSGGLSSDTGSGSVTVNNKTGSNITLVKSDIGLSNVPNVNTTDASNISTGTLNTSVLPIATPSTIGVIKTGNGLNIDAEGLATNKLGIGLKYDDTYNIIPDVVNIDVTQLKNFSAIVTGSPKGFFNNTATLSTFADGSKGDFWIFNGTNGFSLGGRTFNTGDQLWIITTFSGSPVNLTTNHSYVANTLAQATTTTFGTVKLGNITPLADSSTPAIGTSLSTAREDHVHPILPNATATAGGKVPTPPNDTNKFFRGDATFAVIPTMGASGVNHKSGLVPDTSSVVGTTKYLREDGTWSEPTGGETIVNSDAVDKWIDYEYLIPKENITRTTNSGQITLTWLPETDATEYKIYCVSSGTTIDFASATPKATLTGNITTYTITGLTNGVIYNCYIKAKANNVAARVIGVSGISIQGFDIDSFDMNTGTAVALSWTAFTEANSYKLQYNTGTSINNPTEVTTTDTSLNLTGLTKDQIYFYRLSAHNLVGDEIAYIELWQVCSDYIRIVEYGGVKTWSRRDPLFDYEFEKAATGQAYRTPETNNYHRLTKTKYKYEGVTGTGFYEIQPIRSKKVKAKIYCDMTYTSVAQSAFYLNGIATGNNVITQESDSSAISMYHAVDDNDGNAILPDRFCIVNVQGAAISYDITGGVTSIDYISRSSRTWASTGNATSAHASTNWNLATILPVISGLSTGQNNNITWCNFFATRNGSGSKCIYVFIDDASKILGWIIDGVEKKYTFAQLGIDIANNSQKKTTISDGVNRMALYQDYSTGIGYLLEFDWNANTCIVIDNALPSPSLPIRTTEEKPWGVQLFTINGRIFYVSGSSSSNYTISVKGAVNRPSDPVITTHSLSCNTSSNAVECSIDLVGYITTTGYIVFVDQDHDTIGGAIGHQSYYKNNAQDMNFWCRTTNIQDITGLY